MATPTLYPDFKLTIDNCDAEPIHRPVAIQGHGYMLVFDEEAPDHLYAASDGIAELFQVSEDTLWNTPARDWLPDSLGRIYDQGADSAPWNLVNPVPIELLGQPYSVIHHTYHGRRFLEIESRVNTKPNIVSPFSAIPHISEALSQQATEQELFPAAALQLKHFTGYDRVMVYQFDKDYNGHVVGEAKEEHLEPFLDLHYPSTDIPEIARQLFLINKSRLISDIRLENRWLAFNPALTPPVPHLDLTLTQLRAISPIHIEYLGNMGVRATLILAIIIENKLWGLFSCHHYRPYFLSYEIRKTAEIIASTFAQRYLEVVKKDAAKLSHTYIQQEISFLSGISLKKEISTQLADHIDTLQHLCEADGVAVLHPSLTIFRNGLAPAEDVILQLRDWLIGENHQGVFASDNLLSQVPDTISLSEDLCGMLAISLTGSQPTFIFWFRRSQVKDTYWGGNPQEAYHIETLEDSQQIRLSPRKSFKKWKERTSSQSKPWRPFELDMAHRVRENLLKKETQLLASKAHQLKEDLQRLTYITSHDLQEPLATVTNYLALLSEELGDQYIDNVKFFTERTNRAAERMKDMIRDLMNYSQAGTSHEYTWIHLPALLQEVMNDLDADIQKNQATIHVGPLPWIRVSRQDITFLFYHLLSNAIKFREADARPTVHVRAERQGHDWVLRVEDDGIGIEEKYFEKIFQIFQRLHREEEYDGNGIGLAICKKVMDAYDGKIWVTSTVGRGSTFWFTIHTANVRTDEE